MLWFLDRTCLLIYTHPESLIFLLVGISWLVVMIVPFLLISRLNPKFDPYFEEYLHWLHYAPNFSVRWMRAGTYANWIGCRSVFGSAQPKVRDFDFRSKIDTKTFYLCVLVSAASIVLILTLVIGNIFLIATGRFSDPSRG